MEEEGRERERKGRRIGSGWTLLPTQCAWKSIPCSPLICKHSGEARSQKTVVDWSGHPRWDGRSRDQPQSEQILLTIKAIGPRKSSCNCKPVSPHVLATPAQRQHGMPLCPQPNGPEPPVHKCSVHSRTFVCPQLLLGSINRLQQAAHPVEWKVVIVSCVPSGGKSIALAVRMEAKFGSQKNSTSPLTRSLAQSSSKINIINRSIINQ